MLVLKQLPHDVERLALAARKSRPMSLRDSSASRSSRGSGSEKRPGRKMRDVISSALRFQFAEGRGVPLGEARDVGERLLEIAPEHERRAVEAEFVARRDTRDPVGEAQILSR
jgi:hypothetical protein